MSKASMRGSAKVWWIVIILIVIIGGVWWWNSQSATVIAPATENLPAATSDQGLSTSPSDSSNAALNQDLNSVDSQINGLNSDNTAVDQSLSASSSVNQ